jgi:hypothetical protein
VRDLQPHEQAILSVFESVAGPFIENGRAALGCSEDTEGGLLIELKPTQADACPVSAGTYPTDQMVPVWFGPDGYLFELWQENLTKQVTELELVLTAIVR